MIVCKLEDESEQTDLARHHQRIMASSKECGTPNLPVRSIGDIKQENHEQIQDGICSQDNGQPMGEIGDQTEVIIHDNSKTIVLGFLSGK